MKNAVTYISQPLDLTEQVPLIVDLDGTLVATDTLWELVIAFLKANPLRVFQLLVWVSAGKAQFKERLAAATTLDVASLPYRSECVAWLRTERDAGRRIYLATGADARVATAIAQHLELFDGVISSDGQTNATGRLKSELIAVALWEVTASPARAVLSICSVSGVPICVQVMPSPL